MKPMYCMAIGVDAQRLPTSVGKSLDLWTQNEKNRSDFEKFETAHSLAYNSLITGQWPMHFQSDPSSSHPFFFLQPRGFKTSK